MSTVARIPGESDLQVLAEALGILHTAYTVLTPWVVLILLRRGDWSRQALLIRPTY